MKFFAKTHNVSPLEALQTEYDINTPSAPASVMTPSGAHKDNTNETTTKAMLPVKMIVVIDDLKHKKQKDTVDNLLQGVCLIK